MSLTDEIKFINLLKWEYLELKLLLNRRGKKEYEY